jgi:hypothetical protein
MTEDAAATARWQERRSRPAGRRWPVRFALRWVPVALLAGAATGLALELVDTAPQALSAGGGMARMAMSLVLVVAILVGGLRAVLMEDPALVVAIPAFALAGAIAYSLAPPWVPGVTVAGTYRLELGTGTGATVSGSLACTWRPGRYRMGELHATEPAILPDGSAARIHASFPGRVVWLERTRPDDVEVARFVDGRPDVLEPPRDAALAPQRTVDGRAGRTTLALVPDRAGIDPPEPGDTLPAALEWACAAPPAGQAAGPTPGHRARRSLSGGSGGAP